MPNNLEEFDSSSIHMACIIRKTHTYIDVIEEIGKCHEGSFWDLIIQALYDLIIIESYKLIDKKNRSMFSLMDCVKWVNTEKETEVATDISNLDDHISKSEFLLKKHRHTRVAHVPKKRSNTLPRFADIKEILNILDTCENLIKKYNKWTKGNKYSTDFKSMYAGGHDSILKYIQKLI